MLTKTSPTYHILLDFYHQDQQLSSLLHIFHHALIYFLLDSNILFSTPFIYSQPMLWLQRERQFRVHV
jgi:phosphoglycerol transferase MdoB-like AlkP superfamily enzyme